MKGFHVCFGVSDRVGPFSPHREVVIQSIWSETCRGNADQWWGVREGEDKVLEDQVHHHSGSDCADSMENEKSVPVFA